MPEQQLRRRLPPMPGLLLLPPMPGLQLLLLLLLLLLPLLRHWRTLLPRR